MRARRRRGETAPVDQVERIVRLVAEVLGDDALGVHLHGSAVSGGLRPASDVDVFVVARRSLDDPARRRLVEGLRPLSGSRAGARPVELAVVVAGGVRPWRYPPTCDFLYGEWLREAFDAGEVPRPEVMPDLALLITMVRAGDRTLAGLPPARLLDPVPHEDVVRASVAGIPGLLDDLADDTRNVLLTFARIWTTVATGEIRAKDAAADWALSRLPAEHRPVLAHARDLYLTRGYAEETWPEGLPERARAHVDHVRAEIARLCGEAGGGRDPARAAASPPASAPAPAPAPAPARKDPVPPARAG